MPEANDNGLDLANVARRARIFERLAEDELQLVASICHVTHYEAGGAVFRAQDESCELFIVQSGLVDIIAGDGSGGDGAKFAEIGPGEVFGEMALIDSRPRSASAICGHPCTLLVIECEALHRLADEHPRLGKLVFQDLARTLAQRLRNADLNLELYQAIS